MAKHPFQGALNRSVYEFLGDQHRALMDDVHQTLPDVHGPRFAAAVLSRIHPGLAWEAQHHPDAFFSSWLEQFGGEKPKTGWGIWHTKTSDLQWLGLAVLVAVTGGALVRYMYRKRAEATPAPETPIKPATPPKPRLIRIAIAAFSGKVRGVGATAENAGDLLTNAAYWWSGSIDAWDGLARDAGLATADDVPESDDVLLVLVYEVSGNDGDTMSSRPEGAAYLRETARSGELRVVGTFTSSDASQLTTAGFRR